MLLGVGQGTFQLDDILRDLYLDFGASQCLIPVQPIGYTLYQRRFREGRDLVRRRRRGR